MRDTTDLTRGHHGNTRSYNSSLHDAGTDTKALVQDAQAMLQEAATLTGKKADELRKRGMELLDQALGKASKYQDQALEKGKELAHTADVYVKDNPWRTTLAAAGVGLLVGMLISSRR